MRQRKSENRISIGAMCIRLLGGMAVLFFLCAMLPAAAAFAAEAENAGDAGNTEAAENAGSASYAEEMENAGGSVSYSAAAGASYGQQVAQQTAPIIKAIDYRTNETILQLLAPSYYTSAEKLDKRTEIAKRDGKTFIQVTDDEVLKELKKDYIVMAFGQSFENVQRDIEQIIQRIVDNLIVTTGSSDPEFAIKNNAEKFLVGLVYLERMYNFQMGSQNIRDVLIYTPNCYGKEMTINQISWLIQIGNAGADNLSIVKGADMFGSGKVFTKNITNALTLAEFLEENHQKFNPGTKMDAWFAQASPAFITERGNASSGLYSRLWADTTLRSHILPLLNVSPNSLFVITNPATITYGIVDCYVDRSLKTSNPSLYQEKINQFQQTLEQSADQQYEFIKLWQRLCKPAVRSELSTNRVVIDSFRLYSDDPYAYVSSLWSEKFGDKAASGVQEFFSPLNMYVSFQMVGAEAITFGVRFYLARMLTDNGLSAYTHELTHHLVGSMMMNQNGTRDGLGAEVYARGLFESYETNDPPTLTMNFIFNRSGDSSRLHNGTPDRFQKVGDLQTYVSGIFDVIYTLDYAEAEAILKRSGADKQKWFHKLLQTADTKRNAGDGNYQHNIDEVVTISLAEAEQLNSIEDLVDKNMLVSRYEVNGMKTLGSLASNGYYVVPLFSANYAGVQNDKGASGDIMIRRNAFDLLAEYGYYGGMVPYISNQYKAAAASNNAVLSDTYILNKIFAGKYSSMTDFKKTMFRKRIAKIDKLSPVTITWNNQKVNINNFQILSQLMEQAVESDLKNTASASSSGTNSIRAKDTQVELLKAEIYKAYLNQTNDFRTSIYTDGISAGGETLPDTSAEDRSGLHLAVFGILAVLTLCAYRWKRKYEGKCPHGTA